MATVALQALGMTAFVMGTLVLGKWLRRNPTKEGAERSSRVLHLMYWLGFGLPGLIGVFRPGLGRFDEVLGIPSLPARRIARVLGVVLFLIGTYFGIVSNQALRRLGSGALAFQLTNQVVHDDIYQRTRNPMSLGFYLQCLGSGLAAGSTYLTLGSLLAVIPAHIFYLKHFEELELELRFGHPYVQYRERVPFLIPGASPGGTADVEAELPGPGANASLEEG